MSKFYRKVEYGNYGYEIWIEFPPNGFTWRYKWLEQTQQQLDINISVLF
jgi:hypothetical protein